MPQPQRPPDPLQPPPPGVPAVKHPTDKPLLPPKEMTEDEADEYLKRLKQGELLGSGC